MISAQTIRDLRAAGVLLRNARVAEQEAAFGTAELQLRALLASPELAAVHCVRGREKERVAHAPEPLGV